MNVKCIHYVIVVMNAPVCMRNSSIAEGINAIQKFFSVKRKELSKPGRKATYKLLYSKGAPSRAFAALIIAFTVSVVMSACATRITGNDAFI